MTRVLVAGATGYVGRHVVREFRRRGHWVRSLVRDPRKLVSLGVDTDDVRVANVTRPASLRDACRDIDVVFSCIGRTRGLAGASFDDVDRRGNEHLLEDAVRAGVKKFVYVASHRGEEMTHLAIVRAHEEFVRSLKHARMPHVIVRPTGFFSDMEAFLNMARSGRVFLLGDGERQINPIHGEDLAAACVDAACGADGEVNVGGPEILSYSAIATLAFTALGKTPRITRLPGWSSAPLVKAMRPFMATAAGVVDFLSAVSQMDLVAPRFGSHRLAEHYKSLV